MSTRALPIAVVASETGISKTLLRKWESRYGFPQPVRSETGIRGYPPEQVDVLRQIKRCLDGGTRASEAIRLCCGSGDECANPHPAAHDSGQDFVEFCLNAIRDHDPQALHALLDRNLASKGVQGFIAGTAAPLTVAVGEAWLRGELRVHEEHMFSATLSRLLGELHGRLHLASARPRVLLTTPPGEWHTLGLEMVACILADSGVGCVTLGAQTPLAEMAAAISDYDVDVLALSFSAAYPARLVTPTITELRQLVPPDIPIWIGGTGALAVSKVPPGVRIFMDVTEVVGAVETVRAALRRVMPSVALSPEN